MRDDDPEWLKKAERAFLDEKRDEAERLTRKALEDAEAAYDVPKTIRALEYLAFLVMAQLNRQDEYQSLQRRMDRMREEYATGMLREIEAEQGPDHPDLIRPLLQLADVYRIRLYEARHALPEDVRDLDDYFGQALLLHDRADAICRSIYGEESEKYATHLMSRSRLFEFHAGAPGEAVELLRHALRIFERADPNSKNARWAKFSLACALRDSGELEESAETYEEILAEGPDSRGNSPVRSLLAGIYRRLGRTDESLALQREVGAEEEVSLAEKPHLKYIHAYHLAGDLMSADRFGEAEQEYRRALELSELSPHENLMMRGIMQRELADCLCELDRAEEAIDMARQSVASVEAELGPDHYHTAASLLTLCQCLLEVGDEESMQPLLERTAEITIALSNAQLARDEGLAHTCIKMLEAHSLEETAQRLRARVASMPEAWEPPEP
ncbi:MAG: tetratricopeptide repeat protein [Planctomycetes bacterium]|nr:tetratricopeptide repeat protein [Planctomycetota bacterium]